MAYELIYTSLQRGLVSSRSGFCTVARTASMPERLAALVEKFSLFEHGKGKEKYSFNKISYANDTYYIITAAFEAGNDYTGRTNFIAHHIVLDSSEIQKYPSPADLILAYKDNFLRSYTKAPQFIEKELDLSALSFLERCPAKTWQALLGDAGCASLLRLRDIDIYAENFSSEDILALFAESSALNLDRKHPWDFTFTTNLLDIEAKQNYNWRTYISDNASLKKQDCINLPERKAPVFSESRLSEYARSAQKTKMESLDLNAGKPIVASNKFVVINAPRKSISPMVFVYVFILSILISIMLYLAFKISS